MIVAERKLAWGVRDEHMPSYLICPCGHWNHFPLQDDRCYSCRRALYADMPTTEVKTTILFRNRRRSQVLCVGWRVPDQGRYPGKKVSNGCGRRIPVAQLEYIQTFWYTPPYSCAAGDYWNMGEGQFICPRCGETNRLYQRHDVVALKSYFKNVVERHDR